MRSDGAHATLLDKPLVKDLRDGIYSLRMIVEEEQSGRSRANYGKKILQTLSDKLTERFGKGSSYRNLKLFRQFYLAYCPCPGQIRSGQAESSANERIGQSLIAQSGPTSLSRPVFTLSWTHYIHLMGVENLEARRFYEIEAVKEHWDIRWLSRQIHSSLYERLALSRDRDAVMKLARQGETMEKPPDVLKNPIVLEFLGMEEKASYTETRLESAILDRMPPCGSASMPLQT